MYIKENNPIIGQLNSFLNSTLKRKYINFDFWFQVRSILKSYRWAPFVPVARKSAMLTVMLLLSKYRLRNVPVIEPGKPDIVNFITQSAVVQGLEGCKGRDWFDSITERRISDLGLPFMSTDEARIGVLNFHLTLA